MRYCLITNRLIIKQRIGLMIVRYLVIEVSKQVNVLSNVSSGTPEKNGDDVANHIENQDDCLPEPVEAQTV